MRLLLARDFRDQADAERRIREILVEEYAAAGRIPKWLNRDASEEVA